LEEFLSLFSQIPFISLLSEITLENFKRKLSKLSKIKKPRPQLAERGEGWRNLGLI